MKCSDSNVIMKSEKEDWNIKATEILPSIKLIFKSNNKPCSITFKLHLLSLSVII